MTAGDKDAWAGKFRLGMAYPEGLREGRPCETHAYIIEQDGSVRHSETNPNPIMLCGRQETVFWEDEGEQTGGMPTCRRCAVAITKRLGLNGYGGGVL